MSRQPHPDPDDEAPAEATEPVAEPIAEGEPDAKIELPEEAADETKVTEYPSVTENSSAALGEEKPTKAASEPEPEPAPKPEPAIAEPPAAVTRLAEALSGLRAAIGGSSYPLVMPSAEDARRIGAALVAQLDDYLLPRLARLDAPLLVVVGGSTGAGKSTLVNSLVRAPVSTAGVLRPTTRSPVLVSNPSDLSWFRQGQLLPGLVRTPESSADPRTLQVVSAPALGAGLAFLDAPDIDSVVEGNRRLAAQLLAAADLWLFVTTAARYADNVPWELLTTARLRGTVIALVLDRVPAEAAADITAHLREMLEARNLGAAPLFVLPETTLDGQGLIAEDTIGPLHDWFKQLAADANARSAVVRQTLDGALAALVPAVAGLADAADDQSVAASALDERVTVAYRTARQTVVEGLRDGRLLRGEVLARWQEFVGTGEFMRTLESRIGQLRDKVVSAITGRPLPGRNLQTALESQLVTLLRGVATDAAEQAYSAWQAHPAGAALLEPPLQRASTELPQRADRLVRDWQQWVLGLVREQSAEKRVVARGAAYAVNGAGLAVMIAVFTSTAFIPTGLEVAVGAGTTVAAQKVLEAVFGDQAIRGLANRAREDLLFRVGELLDAEAARFTERTAATGLDTAPATDLRRAAAEVENARAELALTGSAT
ncbi:GTPase domain-containing protein [Paractinoplanes durhamensis]|uniref:ABC transporter n=1 Tax=Paractinoplanes durhamensis TaxID=113563 RepID=A0ABQ3ZCG4_9ACTN|nr:ABC transporter [Actinoplanes durhamensis]